ncbi:O-methyltransferase [Arundinibacter roseus]|uniref:Class I SAM-dependent methyltransferase n=1 Tax=Arundinibacter roseus TaxID=2070510 RepID=A0A4R4K9P2_9BACT|nr:class I SAM-dependent methyltransferase [Arundinibacter roseus]TDB64547.1 class I SAM-dependent methyltransferase [Arundinibacter roseus]
MISSYLTHFFRAGNEHSIHSPFVFDLYTQVIRPPKKISTEFKEIEALRRKLLKVNDEIEILDLGAGSRRHSSNRRKISTIVKNAEKPAHFGELFYRLTRHFQPQTILELGTSLGLTTGYFAAAAPKSRLVTMEGCPETARLALENFKTLNFPDIQCVVGNIDQTLPKWVAEQEQLVDMAFFDANHRYEPTIRYFNEVMKKASSQAVFIFDDIYWSDEMKQAWEYIKAQPDVTVTIDLFWIGLVFFRKEQVKENFVLRF